MTEQTDQMPQNVGSDQGLYCHSSEAITQMHQYVHVPIVNWLVWSLTAQSTILLSCQASQFT